MFTRRTTDPSLADARETQSVDAFPARRELPRRAAIGGVVLLGSLALSLLLSGCGSQSSESPGDAHAEDVIPVSSQSAVASTGSGDLAQTTADTVTSSALPPDLSVTAMDTDVEPGETVHLYAEATPDASELILWDGLHDRQSLSYDSEAKVWHGSYRVPLATRVDRIGLSVTARNAAGQWRRVWVFLTVGRGEPEEQIEEIEAAPDSVEEPR